VEVFGKPGLFEQVAEVRAEVVAEQPLQGMALPVHRGLRQNPAVDPDSGLVQLFQGEEGTHVPEPDVPR
jgi:hypothetical protein